MYLIVIVNKDGKKFAGKAWLCARVCFYEWVKVFLNVSWFSCCFQL